MNETSSSTRGPAFSIPSEIPSPEMPSPDGSSSGRTVSSVRVRALEINDPPTVISQRGLPPAEVRSDSVMRILHGRILPGERLGHYELLKYVGGGGMGKVFRALDTRLNRSVAVKILSPEHAADRETVLRFQNEAQSAARLDHDNIARVHYVGEDRGLHYIVFEFIDGVNVRDLVERNGPLPLGEAISYVLQVAEALGHAAERNVVHRDIKPSNLLITPAGQAKLIDMGLARLREVDATAADLTASGVTLGTFDYISPEQARDPRNTDVRSDIYSLGCTFFFMLAGRPPFLGGTMLQKLLQHQADQPPDLRQFRPELSEDVNRILRKMLAKDPKHRYASPQELVNELLWVAKAAGLRPTLPGGRTWTKPVVPVRPGYYWHLPWIVSVLALVAIVVVLDSVWPQLPGPSPASNRSDDGVQSAPAAPWVGAPSVGAPAVLAPPAVGSAQAAQPAAPKAAGTSSAAPKAEGIEPTGPVLPVLPAADGLPRPITSGGAKPPFDSAAKKGDAEKTLPPAAKPDGSDSSPLVPDENGE